MEPTTLILYGAGIVIAFTIGVITGLFLWTRRDDVAH